MRHEIETYDDTETHVQYARGGDAPGERSTRDSLEGKRDGCRDEKRIVNTQKSGFGILIVSECTS